jgi:hypothetical protein
MAGQYRFKDSNGNIIAQISASVDGVISFSGSQVNFSEANTINLGDVQLAGTASNALLLDGFDSQAFAFTSSIHPFTSSTNSRLNSIETISASNISRINSLETTSASVNTLNTTQNSRLDSLEAKTGSLASTGSNTFIGTQTITGSLYISSDLIVQGSSSLQNITASAVSIGTNIVNLNTANPAIRYAGLVIGDSGSIGSSGSFLYDSVQDEMIFVHRGANTTVTSSVTLMGPQTYDSIGNETYLTTNRLPKGVGNEHLIDSNITDIGSSVGIGITNPTYPLTRNGMTLKASGTDGAEFVMLSSTDTGFTGGVLTRNGMDFGFINRTSGSVIFATNATERMFITSAGKVGIGISNPTRQLDIVATGEQLRLSYDGSTTYTDFRNDSAGGLLINTSAGYIIHYIASSLIMRMNANGQVGIGTNPSEKLDVNGNIRSTGTSTILRLDNTGGTPQSWWVGQDIAGTNDGIFYIYNTTSSTHALTINKSNRVGIGIGSSTAYSPLTLKGSNISWGETVTIYPAASGYTTISLRLEGSDTTTGTWAFGKQSTQENGGVEYLQFVKNGLTGGGLHRADAVQTFNPSNGNALFGFKVGIGITNPGSSLSIGAVSTGTGTSSPVLVDLGSTYGTNAVGKNQKIKLWSSTSGDNYTYGIGVSSALLEITAATDASIGFYKNGTTPTELGRFTNSGAFTRPLQPAFLAYSTNSGFNVTGGSWYNISNALTEEQYDIGSNYSGGRFTAPVAGRYLFYAGGWANIGTSSNGERYAFCAQVNGSGLTFISGGNYCITDSPLSPYSIVYSLNAGDYVDLLAFSSVSGQWGPGTHRVFWGGYLL